jgi:chromosomal replication initiation ATPase DnaA
VRKFSSALVSRFMAGMVVRLDAPDPSLRQRIVLHLALKRGPAVRAAAAALIASRCTPPGQVCSVRDLEGALTRIEALLRLHPELAGASDSGEIGLVLVRRALGVDSAAAVSGPAPPDPRRADS